MRTILQHHPIAWTPPAPFWTDADHAAMRAPSILRFTTDDFIEELQRLLASDPEKLMRHVAVPETWRGIRTPARLPNPTAGRNGLFSRLGVTARRRATPSTPKPEILSTARPSDGTTLPLKLYQPAHQRYYLVGATLICQQPGLPDRKIDPGKEEKASFVIRRWFPQRIAKDEKLPDFDPTWIEHGYVAQPDGTFAWVPVPPPNNGEDPGRRVLANEELLPLFPLSYEEDDRRNRRLLAGLIPVGKREAYHSVDQKPAQPTSSDSATAEAAAVRAARRTHFRKIVSEPWKALVDRVAILISSNVNASGAAQALNADELQRFRSDIQLSSWLILAELRGYLETYAPDVWRQIEATTFPVAGTGTPGSLSGSDLALYRALIATRFERFRTGAGAQPLNPPITSGATAPWNSQSTMASCLGDALKRLTAVTVSAMDGAERAFDRTKSATDIPGWPTFMFPLVDPADPLLKDANNPFGNSAVPVLSPPVTLDEEESASTETQGGGAPQDLLDAAKKVKGLIDSFAAVVLRAVRASNPAPSPSVPAAAQKSADLRPGWFKIRCVYQRPACGALHEDVVSASTEKFQLAHFFDPDAPARPIRIGLPIDTTPAGLRKFDKNTAFVMSDVLCGQVARMRGLTFGDLIRSVLPFPLHKDLSVPDGGPCKSGGSGPNIGLICSLSIPIITICALILLLIMVALLDLIFRWIPYFILCFPLPGLRAKQQ